jgi:hypothetical protein
MPITFIPGAGFYDTEKPGKKKPKKRAKRKAAPKRKVGKKAAKHASPRAKAKHAARVRRGNFSDLTPGRAIQARDPNYRMRSGTVVRSANNISEVEWESGRRATLWSGALEPKPKGKRKARKPKPPRKRLTKTVKKAVTGRRKPTKRRSKSR